MDDGTYSDLLTDIDVDNLTSLNQTSNITKMNMSDYDIDFSPPLEEMIPVSIVYGGTLVLGMVGNMLVIFSVTRYEQMQTVTNTFLLSLASADLLLVLVCVPVKVSC